MRDKKYRPWKTIIFLCLMALITATILIFVAEKRIIISLIVCESVFVVGLIFFALLYFEVQLDCIIVRQGVFSLNKAYQSSIKKRVFFFEDIKDITVEQKKIVWIDLKDGNTVSFAINCCIKKEEIIGLIYEVRAQIKGYEQQYI